MPRGNKVGALWENVMRDGTVYFKGNADGKPVVVFANGFKKDNPKAPDWIIYEDFPREDGPPPRSHEPGGLAPVGCEGDHPEDGLPF